jgi:hypothetical protein
MSTETVLLARFEEQMETIAAVKGEKYAAGVALSIKVTHASTAMQVLGAMALGSRPGPEVQQIVTTGLAQAGMALVDMLKLLGLEQEQRLQAFEDGVRMAKELTVISQK